MAYPRLFALAATPTPLQASWSNYDGTSTIYITRDATLNQASLVLTNQSGQQLALAAGAPVPYDGGTGSQSTLYLFFQGMLSNAEVAAIRVAATSSPAWEITSFIDPAGPAYLALSPQAAVTIPDGGSLTVPFTNLLATSTDFSGNVTVAIVTGTAGQDGQVFINVQNPPAPANKELELLVGFAGTDLVFTGSQPNALTLYLTNPQTTALVPGGVHSWGPNTPTFQLSLVFGDGAGALTSTAEASNVAINLGNTFGNDYSAVAKQAQGAVPVWKVQPSSAGSGTVLGTGQNATITLDFTNIIAAQPQGLTYAYLSYSNIPGYNDGYYALEIIKVNPVVISSFTALPTSLANVTGPTPVTLSFKVQNAGYVTIINADYARLVTEDDFGDTVTVTAYANTVYTLIASNYATGQVVSRPLVLAASTPDLLATSFAADSGTIANSLIVNGSIGLGTTSPSQKLTVVGNTSVSGNSTIGGNGTITGNSTIGGNVGIGTATPGQKLDVAGNATVSGLVGIGTSSPAAKLTVQPASNAELGLRVNNGVADGTAVSGNIVLQPLTGGDSGFSFLGFNGSNANGETRYSTGKNRWRLGVDQRSTSDELFIDTYDGTSNTSALRITPAGNVGLGTSPSAQLHVAGGMKIDGKNTLEFGAGIAGKEQNAGKIGYHAFSDDGLDIVGAGNTGGGRLIRFYCENGASFNGQVNAPSFYHPSDQRFKQNVRPLGGALASVLALRGVRYEWNAPGVQRGGKAGAPQVGLIAQELEKVYPELVSIDKDGYKAVNYSQLTPVLIEAIKELKAENAALTQEAAAAKAEASSAKTEAARATATLDTFEARLRRLEAGSA